MTFVDAAMKGAHALIVADVNDAPVTDSDGFGVVMRGGEDDAVAIDAVGGSLRE